MDEMDGTSLSHPALKHRRAKDVMVSLISHALASAPSH
jgi:hypothetical protein